MPYAAMQQGPAGLFRVAVSRGRTLWIVTALS
jgi:hypothetical protein